MRLSGREFDWRYEQRDDLRAELVQGVVYVSSPVRIDEHAEPNAVAVAWVKNYAVTHRETRAATNGTARLSEDDRVQPDAMLWKRTGGSATVAEDHYMDGGPELVVEVTASSKAYDLGPKMESYRQAGVQEYVIWMTEEWRIIWYSLEDSLYRELQPGPDGWTESRVFPGLRLHIPRLLDGDDSVILPGAS